MSRALPLIALFIFKNLFSYLTCGLLGNERKNIGASILNGVGIMSWLLLGPCT